MFGLVVVALTAFSPTSNGTLTTPKTDCTPDSDHGCFNGFAYSYASEFPCGSHNVYKYSEASCCEQGRTFSTTDEYCCTGSGVRGVHSYDDGKCDFHTPTDCACNDVMVTEKPQIQAQAGDLIDTSSPPEGGYQCKDQAGDNGCLNGYPFGFDTYSACGKYLMKFGKFGCCPSSIGFLPYLLGVQYCCKVEGAPPGQDYNISLTSCSCHRYGCDGWPAAPDAIRAKKTA